MRLLWTGACLAQICSAFYPYHLPTPDDPSKLQSRAIGHPQNNHTKHHPFYSYHMPTAEDDNNSKTSPRAVQRPWSSDNGSIRMFMKRMFKKRKNSFNVIPAADPKQADSLGVDQDGTDFSYFCAFNFGTSQEDYYLLLDSAASNTWVMGSDCTTDACTVHNTFGPPDSSSLKVSTTTFSVAYGTGSVKGILGTDTIHFGSISVPLTFGLGETVSSDFSSYPMDGILGLGRPDIITGETNGVNAPSLMDVLVSEKIISSKLFGIDIWRDADGGSNNGEINFGAPDTSRYDGALKYIPAITNSNGFWEIAVSDAGVDGKSAGLSGRSAIIDSGTSFILMPSADAAKVHQLIPGSTQSGETFTVPCNTINTVQITFGGTAYDVSSQDYVGRALGGGSCSSNIVGRTTFGPTQWLVGDVFLKNVYAAFDYDGQRIGFGVKVKASTAASSTMSTPKPAKTTDSTFEPSLTPPTPTPIPTSVVSTTSIPPLAPVPSTSVAAPAPSTPTTSSTATPLSLAPTHTTPTAQAPTSTKTQSTKTQLQNPVPTTTTKPTTTSEPTSDQSSESSPSLTSSVTDSSTATTPDVTRTQSGISTRPTSFTAGLIPGASFTTTTSSGASASGSTTASASGIASASVSHKTGGANRLGGHQSAAMMALAFALCYLVGWGV